MAAERLFGDDIREVELSDGRWQLTHRPSGESVILGPDGFEADTLSIGDEEAISSFAGALSVVNGALTATDTDTQLSQSDVVSALDGQDVGSTTPLSSINSEEGHFTSADVGSLLVTDSLNGPSVATVSDLPDDVDAGTTIYVESEQRYYRMEA